MAPSRILDTRDDIGASGPLGADATIRLQVAGRGGVPADGVAAVVLNLTATNATMGGYITAYPSGTALPTASNLNYPAGDTRANAVVVRLGTDGAVQLRHSGSGTVDLVADVAGYYLAGSVAGSGAFTPLDPTRVLDTRVGTGASGPLKADSTLAVQIAGRAGVPATGVAAVVMNLTETGATAGGYLTAYPSGTPLPTASNLNYPAHDTRANLVTVKLGADGRVAIRSHSSGTVQVVADIAGFFLADGPDTAGTFTPLAPARILDTRTGNGATGPVAANGTVRLQVTGRGGVPASGVSAVVLTLTETDARLGGFVASYPGGACEPDSSSLNFPASDTRANQVVALVGPDGSIALRSHSSAALDLVADVAGYYSPNTVPAVNPSFADLAAQAISAKQPAFASRLGTASGALAVDGCTAQQDYQTGAVVYTNFTGAHALVGPVWTRYQALGGYAHTGVPTSDVADLPGYAGATSARFTRGALVSSDHGVRWMDAGTAGYYFDHGAGGAFGAPITDSTSNSATFTGDSWVRLALPGQTSASSELYRLSSGQVFWVHGAIFGTWSGLGYADGPLGRPWSNEYVDGVTMQTFSTGRIMRGTSGWRAVYGDVWRIYSSSTHRAAKGDLGLPSGAGSYWVQDFANGRIDHGRIRARANATSHATTSDEVRYTFHSGCPVGASSLRTIEMNYLGFDHRVHRGVMIVRSDVTGQVIDSFAAAAWDSFAIRQMVNPNHWYGDDYKMMADDNTSAFNCRKVSGNPYALSPHSYGRAIDINDFENPYQELGVWYPYKNWYATHRDASKPGVLVSSSTLTEKLVGHGFYWGAWWSQPDYQHFQK